MKKRKKLPSMRSLEKKLDDVFSQFIKRRESMGHYALCFTCNKRMSVELVNGRIKSEAQCGHFVKRQHRSLRWEPLNAQIQCPRCNMYGGAQDEFAARIVDKYGAGILSWLLIRKHETVRHTRADLEKMIDTFK